MFIVYRAYAGETDGDLSSLRPNWFSKFNCWESFWNEFCSVDVVVLWDGECSGKFYEHIKMSGVKIFNFGKLGNKGSLEKTYQLLKNSNDKTVCTVEDDFLFVPGCRDVLLEGFRMGFYMMTPYEHMDRYLWPHNDYSFGKEHIYLGTKCYYRSVESTTGTCFFRKLTFDFLYDKLIEFNVNDRAFFRYAFSQGIRLFSPMPGYASHVCVDRGINLMGPFVNWEQLNKSFDYAKN
mgnify:CR=1 FL=1